MGKSWSKASDTPLPSQVTQSNVGLSQSLQSAARQGNLADVRHYLEAGADVNSSDVIGMTALMWAASNGHLSVVEFLVKEGSAKVDHQARDEMTALIWAARNGHLQVVEFLVKEGSAKVDQQSKDGMTALMFAAKEGELEVVEFLVKEGSAKVDHENKDGKTAEQLALERGHTRIAQVLKEARLAKAVREISSTQVEGTQVEGTPIKIFALGKAYAGKTEILKSLFCKYEGYQSVYEDTEDYNKRKIKGRFETRTIGINVYHVKVAEQRLSIFDCGGLDNYYMLHSLFTKVDNSIILVVFSLTKDDGSLKGKAEIKAELKQQIAFVKSKSACKCDDNVLLIGTHKDLLREEQVKDCEVMLDQISSVLEREEGFRFPFYKLVNATERQNDEMKEVLKETLNQSRAIANAQDDDRKSVPSLCFSACERLKSHAKDTNRMVLHWETVYELVKDEAMKCASVDLQRGEVFDICLLLDTFGMLLVSQPEDMPKEQLKEDPDKLFVIPDLNWFFSKFLGVIFSPAGYLQDPDICRNGYVALSDLARAFKGFDLSQDQIVTVLKEYKVVCDSKQEGELLIPGALSNKKRPEWSCCGDNFAIILGRRCENVGGPFNIGTMPKILSRLGQMWPTQSMEVFCSGVVIFQGCYMVSVDSVNLQTAIEVCVGVEKSTIRGDNLEKILEELGDLMDTVYLKVVCGTAESKNLSTTMITYALSCSWLLGLKPGEPVSVTYLYEIHYLEKLFLQGVKEVRHYLDRTIKDEMRFLLTRSNIKEFEGHYVGRKIHRRPRAGITDGKFLRDLPLEKMQTLKHKLENPPFGFDGWQVFASHFKEVKDEVEHIQVKANNSECARELLFQVRRSFEDEPSDVLKDAFLEMGRADLALMLDDDSLLNSKIGELSPMFIEKLSRKFCSADLVTSSRHMEHLAELLGLEKDHVIFMIEKSKPPEPTDLMFRLLIDRNPNITVEEVANVFQKMEWGEVVELLKETGF